MRDDHLYMLDLMRVTGESLGRVGFVPDWDPAIEWTRWVGLRTRGGTQGVGRATTHAVVGASVAVLAVDFFLTRFLISVMY